MCSSCVCAKIVNIVEIHNKSVANITDFSFFEQKKAKNIN